MPATGVFQGKGFFKNARRFMFWKPVLVDNSSVVAETYKTVVNNNVNIITEPQLSNDSIKLLEDHTIRGAAYDSSERDPPPSCHPETRLEFCETIKSWMSDPNPPRKVLWLHGSAGVGKSAIMQTTTQVEANSPDSTLGATIFFSRPNQRDGLKRLFTTIAYQLSVRYQRYRQYVTNILANDPQIVVKSTSEQFKWFIVKPFIEQDLFRGHCRAVSIFLDGLDECKGEEAQRELILLIRRFALQHPNAPLIWLIASRPEPHIHSAFSSSQIRETHWEIDVQADSDQACADVERFLRDKFLEIRERYSSFFPLGNQMWPSELDFLKIASAAPGHFLFVDLVVRFIIDESYGNPVSQLQTVLAVIDSTSSSTIQSNPFSLLDNLYAQILSSIPLDVLPRTKLLLAWSFFYPWKGQLSHPTVFPIICNWLNLEQAAAYGALRKLHSVIRIPPPDEVYYYTRLEVFHASFIDYLGSPSRSGKYYTMLTYEEAMPPIFLTLLESHDSANSAVDPSRIHLSWNYGERERKKVQNSLWRRSFELTIGLIDVISSMEDSPNYLNRLAIFLGDLDYGSDFIESFNWRPVLARHLHWKPMEVFTTLQDWGIARTIGLDSINLDSIRPGVVLGFKLVEPSDMPPFLRDRVHGIELRTNGTDWGDHVKRHLDEIAQFQQPVWVVLIGEGSKSAIWITGANGGWFYTFPYNQF